MAVTKLNEQHDYITLKVEFVKGSRVNLTANRWGGKVSGTTDHGQGPFNALFKAFADTYLSVKGPTMGQRMKDLEVLARKATSIASLTDILLETAASWKGDEAKGPETLKAATVEEATITVVDNLIQGLEVPPPTGLRLTYSQDELQAAFDLVRNKKDWKARIDARIPKDKEAVVLAAIVHFTATVGRIYPHPTNPDKLIVRAAGYRMGPAGP